MKKIAEYLEQIADDEGTNFEHAAEIIVKMVRSQPFTPQSKPIESLSKSTVDSEILYNKISKLDFFGNTSLIEFQEQLKQKNCTESISNTLKLADAVRELGYDYSR